MNVASSTKDQLLREAQTLLQTKGYDSFSFQDLANKVGIRKASVHSHFKDKEELGIKLIDQYFADFDAWKAFHAHKKAVDQLKSFYKMVRKQYLGCNMVCVNGSFLADWESVPSRVQTRSLEFQKYFIDWIATTLEHARKDRDLSFEGDAGLRAKMVTLTMMGTLQAARAWKDPELFDACLATLIKDLGGK